MPWLSGASRALGALAPSDPLPRDRCSTAREACEQFVADAWREDRHRSDMRKTYHARPSTAVNASSCAGLTWPPAAPRPAATTAALEWLRVINNTNSYTQRYQHRAGANLTGLRALGIPHPPFRAASARRPFPAAPSASLPSGVLEIFGYLFPH